MEQDTVKTRHLLRLPRFDSDIQTAEARADRGDNTIGLRSWPQCESKRGPEITGQRNETRQGRRELPAGNAGIVSRLSDAQSSGAAADIRNRALGRYCP